MSKKLDYEKSIPDPASPNSSGSKTVRDPGHWTLAKKIFIKSPFSLKILIKQISSSFIV
jgi:hypothetical protein